ncbi:hypothetical protein TrVGV298_007190 [Trichoderma virens]|nr:hypothetical protein TrVGV298_007190 [Trichoderma virens]
MSSATEPTNSLTVLKTDVLIVGGGPIPQDGPQSRADDGVLGSNGVPVRHGVNKIFATGFDRDGHLIAQIKGLSPKHKEIDGAKLNDGSVPLELPLRLSGIVYERVLKFAVEQLPNVSAYWGS